MLEGLELFSELVEHLCAVLELVMQLQSKRYATHGGTCNIHGRTDGKCGHGNEPNQSKSGAMSWRPRDVGCCYEPSMAEQLGRLQHSAISCWTATIKPSSQNSGFSYTTRRLSSHTAWSNRHKALSSVQCRNYWILQLFTLFITLQNASPLQSFDDFFCLVLDRAWGMLLSRWNGCARAGALQRRC